MTTLKQILDEDTRKQIAERLISGDIRDLIAVYKDHDNRLYWATNLDDWTIIIGLIDQLAIMVKNEWQEDMDAQEESQNEN